MSMAVQSLIPLLWALLGVVPAGALLLILQLGYANAAQNVMARALAGRGKSPQRRYIKDTRHSSQSILTQLPAAVGN